MNFEILLQTPVFKGLNEEEIKSLFSLLPYRIKKFMAGSLLASSGDEVESLLIVLSGVVKGEMIDYSGRIIKIEDIPAPGALAAAFIFGNNNRFPVTVAAVTDVDILVIDKSDFLRLMLKNERILRNFLDMISNRSQFLSEKIKFLNFKTIRGKLAQYILQLAGGKKRQVRLDKTQNDLGDFFGVARPSIARAIKDMEDEGLISAHGRDITVLDIKKLKEMTID
jgi:CRP-like cAMP-binding protein